MSRITQFFGATMIVGAGAIASQIEPIETKVDNALGEAKTFLQTEFQMTEKQALEFGLGGALLLSLIGAGAIASGARNKLRAQQSMNTDIQDSLKEINAELNDGLVALKNQISDMDMAVVALEGKVLEPLNIDLGAVEDAIARLEDTKLSAGETLEAIRNIETEVDKVVASMAPRDFAGELAEQRQDYSEAYEELVESTSDAFEYVEGYTKQHAKIMAKLSELDANIKQSILNGTTLDAALPSAFLETIAEQLGDVEDNYGECSEFADIVKNASNYVHKASEYLLTNLEKRQQAQQIAAEANGVSKGANPDAPPQQMHEDMDHNAPARGIIGGVEM